MNFYSLLQKSESELKALNINLFDVRSNCGNTIFHWYKYEESFLKDLLCVYPTNLFDAKDNLGNTIFKFHNYSEDFIEYCKNIRYCSECLCGKCEKYVKDNLGNTIFKFHNYSEDFIEYCKNIRYCSECLCRKCEKCENHF